MKESCLKCQRGKNIMELFDFIWDKENDYCFKKNNIKLSFKIINYKDFFIGIALNKPYKITPKTNILKIKNYFIKNIVFYD